MGSLGWPELIVIALIAVLLFGAGRLADIGKGLGQGIKNFKQGVREAGEDDAKTAKKSAKDDDEAEAKPAAKEATKDA